MHNLPLSHCNQKRFDIYYDLIIFCHLFKYGKSINYTQFLGESQIKRHAGVTEENGVIMVNPKNSHAVRMKNIEGKFGNGQELSRNQLFTIMFTSAKARGASARGAASANLDTEIFEAMHVYHAVTQSQSYSSCGKLMRLQRFLLCRKKNVFHKKIKCGEMKARAIAKNVLSVFCLQKVCILLRLMALC